jgi:peptidyl-prolyl cis-trans isomerase SurA
MFLLLLPSFTHAVVIDKIAAIVNEDVITDSEITALTKLDLHLSGLPQKESVLQSRIDHHLVLQQMNNQPPVALTDDEVEEAISTYVTKYGNIDQLADFLTQIGMNYSDFEQEVRQQLSIRKFIRDRFRPFVNITIEEAEKYYETAYKPALEMLGKEAPPFEESFNEVQTQMVEAKMEDRIVEWLGTIRKEATVNIKD